MNAADIDGRRLRSQQSRQRIVDAMIELVRAGIREPTAEQVAARAGLAMRTVFRHFADMEGLYREICRRMHARGQAIAAADIRGATWQDTLHNLIDRRVRLYEEMLPIRLAADVVRHRSAVLQQDHERLMALLRQAVRDVLPARITRERLRFEAIDALLGYEFWIRLRCEQGLSVRDATVIVRRAVDAQLQA